MIKTITYEGKYTHLWQKYRPIVLKLMVDASEGPQKYQFQRHEFADLNNHKPNGYSFKLEVFKNEKKNKVTSSVASDLLSILQSSAKADELTLTSKYLFRMDSKFMLEVSQVD